MRAPPYPSHEHARNTTHVGFWSEDRRHPPPRLAELEAQAVARGVHTLRLETNRTLTEAIGLYRAAGYREVDPFNDEPYAHYWFEKTLDGAGTG